MDAAARAVLVDGPVELARDGSNWSILVEGSALRGGDRLHTRTPGLARIESGQVRLTLSGEAGLSLSRGPALAAVLEQGRVELHAAGGESVSISTAEAEIRGTGRIVVRREGERTLVSVLSGSSRVAASGRTLELAANTGAVIGPGKSPLTSVPLPVAPAGLQPGSDPRYTPANEAVTLAFVSEAPAHHVQVLAIDSDETLIERDVTRSTVSVSLPWPGTFRWRVAARSAEGLEGPPSVDGLLAVVAR